MENEKIIQTFKFNVTGRVQGVSFRYSTMLNAQKLNIVGNIQNETDGSVSGVIQGEKKQIDQILAYLENGPQFALVQSLQIQKISPINVNCFEILY